MRQWTPEQRQRQRELIRSWQPWKKGGVKTAAGKAKSKMNALKHGRFSAEMRKLHRYFALCRARLRLVAAYLDIPLKSLDTARPGKRKTAERTIKRRARLAWFWQSRYAQIPLTRPVRSRRRK